MPYSAHAKVNRILLDKKQNSKEKQKAVSGGKIKKKNNAKNNRKNSMPFTIIFSSGKGRCTNI